MKRNMHRAVAMCYIIISASYLIVTITGYWVSQGCGCACELEAEAPELGGGS